MSVVGYVELTLQFEREGRMWVGTCRELGTSTYSESFDQVQNDLCKLVEEHLDLLGEAGERERFFEKHGIRFFPRKPKPHDIRLPDTGVDLLRQMVPLFQPRIFRIAGSEPRALAGV